MKYFSIKSKKRSYKEILKIVVNIIVFSSSVVFLCYNNNAKYEVLIGIIASAVITWGIQSDNIEKAILAICYILLPLMYLVDKIAIVVSGVLLIKFIKNSSRHF